MSGWRFRGGDSIIYNGPLDAFVAEKADPDRWGWLQGHWYERLQYLAGRQPNYPPLFRRYGWLVG